MDDANHTDLAPAVPPVRLGLFIRWRVAIKENPKRDGLGTIARLGPKTAFVGVGGTGELSR